MTKIIEINGCKDCPKKAHIFLDHYCGKTEKVLTFANLVEHIPDWCPLPDKELGLNNKQTGYD